MRRQFADLGDPIGQLTHDGMILSGASVLIRNRGAEVTDIAARRSLMSVADGL
jgi:hypothetical protein